jgi:Glycosyl hydrolases family 18
MITYDDPESIAAKAAYVGQEQLGGLMMWELAMDDDAHTLVDAVAGGLAANCDPTPRAGCDAAGKSALTVANGKLTWSFQKGVAARTLADFGTPATSTTYTLCLYDHGARVWQAKVGPGPGWRQNGRFGWAYKAKDGITRVALRGGDAGKPKVQVKGRGAAVATLTTPLADPIDVTVQLVQNASAVCWSDTYTGARINNADAFRATRP